MSSRIPSSPAISSTSCGRNHLESCDDIILCSSSDIINRYQYINIVNIVNIVTIVTIVNIVNIVTIVNIVNINISIYHLPCT